MQVADDTVKIPAMRDGVGASSVRLPPGRWLRLIDFLDQHFADVGREAWQSRMRRGLVLSASGAALSADTPYVPGDIVHYYRELEHEPEIPFEADVLYRDAHLLIADKPHFLPVVPSGRFLQQSLLVRLRRLTGLDGLSPLHRIDRGTAGLVAFSVDPDTRGRYQALFATRRIEKVYEALAPANETLALPFMRQTRIVRGDPFFLSQEVDGAPNSETVFESATPYAASWLYRLRPLTGKKHQLRLHMAAVGVPIDNDPLYPQLRDDLADDYSRPLKLLARSLVFVDPLSGKRCVFESRRNL